MALQATLLLKASSGHCLLIKARRVTQAFKAIQASKVILVFRATLAFRVILVCKGTLVLLALVHTK
jgi:hypothetical protein